MITGQSASMEDYLEAIMMLRKDSSGVRVTEVSKALGVSKPSVTAALKKLSQDGLVRHERYGHAELTAEGRVMAEDVFRRHEVLRHFLADILNIDPNIAVEDACKMEHHLSPATLERLAKFVEFVISRPKGQPEWLRVFNYYFEHGEPPEGIKARCSKDE